MSRNSSWNRRVSWLAMKLRRVNPYLGSFGVAALFLGLACRLPERTSHWSASAIFLMAVLAIASIWGPRQAAVASIAVALAYDYFFIPPVYSLDIDDWQNALSVLILGLSASIVSILATRLKRKTLAARRNEILAKRQARFSRQMRESANAAEIAHRVTASAGVAVGAKTLLLASREGSFETVAALPWRHGAAAPLDEAFPHGEEPPNAVANHGQRPLGLSIHAVAAHPQGAVLTPVEIEALKRALAAKPRKIGDSPSHDGLTCTAIPMSADGKEQAFLIVCETSRRFWQLSNRMRIVDLIAGAASSAFKRVAAQTLAEEARIAAESEKLRSALLESISHDLKTPLAVVLGSASSLKDLNSGLSERDAQELLQAILDEGARLDQFIGNLLDMTRVESEALRPKRELADLNDIIGSALRRASRSLAAHRVELKVPADLPSLEIDPVLMEKALFNILENAANYTPAGTRVTVSVLRSRDRLILQVWDEGQGIPQRELSHIFEKFYRGGSGSWKPAGTGLGLSITRGFVQAMGGEITASNRTDHSGAVFTIKLPISKAKWRSMHVPQTCKAS